ncbi:MAG TPA: hypothetical protein VHQ65_15235 [Thermoanaerobaculia bacterium]|nr:hypothetical protein [Thermoanaerobaculia bacterium]
MTPIFFSFRAGVSEDARSTALERVRAIPAVERAGRLFPEGSSGESGGTLVAAVADGFDPASVVAELTGMPEIQEASLPAPRVLID